jgi:hypothetical protein
MSTRAFSQRQDASRSVSLLPDPSSGKSRGLRVRQEPKSLARLGLHKTTIPVLPRAKIWSARAKDRFSARQVPYDIAN